MINTKNAYQRYSYKDEKMLINIIDHAKSLLKNHKCRITRHKPAGGSVCDICQALFALESIKKQATTKNRDIDIPKRVIEQHKSDKQRLEKALKEQGFQVGPFTEGPDIRD